jgi:hypothetical protein
MPLSELGPALALAVPGAVALRAAAPGLLPGAGLILAALTLPLPCPVTDIQTGRYYLPCYALLAILIGLGAARLLSARPAWGLAALAVLAVPAWQNSRTCPRDRHYIAYDFAFNQLFPLPPGAILICEGDDQAFPLFYLHDVQSFRADVDVLPMPFACWKPSYDRLKPAHPNLVFPPFVNDPGRHLPDIIAANAPRRPAFYAPGCTGAGSEKHLVPEGVVFAAYANPDDADSARRVLPRFPELRLRGAADAGDYGDPVTLRAVHNYGFAIAFHGSRALERGDLRAAERYLSAALRLPMEKTVSATALTHLALVYGLTGRIERAEPAYRRAIALVPDFAPALFGLGKLLLIMRRDYPEAREMMRRAARKPDLLTASELRELRGLLSRLR